MGGNTIKGLYFIGISVISGFAGLLFSQLILPAFETTFQDPIHAFGIVDTTNIISWAAILMTFGGLMLTIIILSKSYRFKLTFAILCLSFVLVVVLLAGGSYIYLIFRYPEVFQTDNILIQFLNFYSYPSLISLKLGNPEPIWIISTIVFLIVFDTTFLKITGGIK